MSMPKNESAENLRCCQPEYCKANAPEDYANPDQCPDCDKEDESKVDE